MRTMMTVFGRTLLLTGLLALAGCGQDRNSGNGSTTPEEQASAPATDTGSKAATAEQQAPAPEAAPATEPAASDESGASSAAGDAERHTITARSTAYDPMVLKIKPGDSVSWVNMGGHNNNFEKGNIPEGVEPWKTQLGNDVSKTFDVEGLYLYKCDPHFALGMVGAIIVGEPTNVEQVEQNAQGMYKRALAKAMNEIE